jgi:hypothetical protein
LYPSQALAHFAIVLVSQKDAKNRKDRKVSKGIRGQIFKSDSYRMIHCRKVVMIMANICLAG